MSGQGDIEPVDPSNPIVVDYEQRRRDLDELAACKNDIAAAIGDRISWLLEMEAKGQLREAETMAAQPFGLAEANARARQPLRYEPGKDRITGKLAPDQVSWNELGNLMEHEPEQARELWLAVKGAARDELTSGVRAAKALESGMPSGNQPWQRARYLAIVDALRTDLHPRGGLEELLIQRMASTYSLCLHWQQEAIRREDYEVFQGDAAIRQERRDMTARQKERQRMEYGYLPPRQAQAEAIQEACLMSERYERAFLRLVREFRNLRRTFNSLIVAGGTVNIADGGPQQVNVNGGKVS